MKGRPDAGSLADGQPDSRPPPFKKYGVGISSPNPRAEIFSPADLVPPSVLRRGFKFAGYRAIGGSGSQFGLQEARCLGIDLLSMPASLSDTVSTPTVSGVTGLGSGLFKSLTYLCFSAACDGQGPTRTAMKRPKTIHLVRAYFKHSVPQNAFTQ